ncbi:MAG: ABC transporter permease [Caulobacteraceae bacterium]
MNRLLRIAVREYLSFLRTPGFWISLLIAPVAGGLGALAPHLAERAAPPAAVAVIDLSHTGAVPAIAKAFAANKPPVNLLPPPPEARSAATPDAVGQALRPYLARGDLDAAVVLSGPPQQVSVDFWSRDLNDPTLQGLVRGAVADSMQQARLRQAGLDPRLVDQLTAMTPSVRFLSPRAASGRVSLRDRLPSILGLGLAFVLFFAIFTGAGILLNSVIEEKASRILEVLLSSASVPEILGGKILGAAALSATVIGGWGLIGVLALAHYAPGLMGDVISALLSHGLIIWFALFFIGGYLMYASIFAAIGAFCETVREAQTLLGPMMLIITIPILFLTLALQHPDAPIIVALSWVPIFTPFIMTARLAAGPPIWEVLGALAVMAATVTAVVWLCARAFRAGALSSGKLDLKRLAAGVFGGRA